MTWSALLFAFVAIYLIILLRYLFVAGLFYWLLWMRPSSARPLYKRYPGRELILSELKWSVISSAIFAIPGSYMIEAWKAGGTAIYSEVADYGWFYLPVSLAAYLLIHDTYFYWTHRLIHRPRWFPIFHKVHHESRTPSPWAAFSFHPYESVLGAAIIPLLTFVIPIHAGVLLTVLTLMTVCSVINHAGYEIFPDYLA